jgi:hypothetical protein
LSVSTGELRNGVAEHGGRGGDSQDALVSTPVAPVGPAAQPLGSAADPRDVLPDALLDLGGRWPEWARAQLQAAQQFVATASDRGGLATTLYREWFCRPVPDLSSWRATRPPAGVYRFAHAGTSRRVIADGLTVLERHDVLGRDGWWRTWGRRWTPPRSRPGAVRVLCTPSPDRLAEFVATVTAALLDSDLPWSLTCATDPRRLRRTGAAVLDLPSLDALPAGLLDALAPALLPAAPPLCLPLAAGVAVAGYPDNGMTFGEHRCHLIALALRGAADAQNGLQAIAETFAAHGIDPAQPYR